MKQFDIFISYKRKSLPTANNLYYRLTIRGYSTFFDLEEMRRDNFDTQLLYYIDKAKDVFVILEKGSLDACRNGNWDKDWFCQEISFALEKKKNIIPILLDGFKMPKEGFFPDKLKGLSKKHSPDFSFSYFNAYIDNLIEKKFITSEAHVDNKMTSVFKFYSNENCQVIKEGDLVCSIEGLSDKPYYLFVPRKGGYRFKAINSRTQKVLVINECIEAESDKIVDIIWEKAKDNNGIDESINTLNTQENEFNCKTPPSIVSNVNRTGTVITKSNSDVDDKEDKEYIDFINEEEKYYSADQLYEKGYNYYYGKGVEWDTPMAVNYFLLAAKKMNHSKSQLFLYRCYYLGIGVEANSEEAIYWLKIAAANNNTEAQIEYAKVLYEKQEYDKAFLWLSRIVNSYYFKDAELCNNALLLDKEMKESLSSQDHELLISDKTILFDGVEMSRDKITSECYNYIKMKVLVDGQSDTENYPELVARAMYYIGYFYENGYYPTTDIRKAKEWYIIAERMGNDEAHYRLCELFDIAKTELNVQVAKETPSILSCADKYKLAQRCIMGKGVDKNLELAAHLLEECTMDGMRESFFELGKCYLTGVGVERDETKAFDLFAEAANLGINEAKYFQGIMMEWGRGVEKNKALALSLYVESAKKDYIPSIIRLAYLYRHGIILGHNQEKAEALIQYARQINELNGEYIVFYSPEELRLFKENLKEMKFVFDGLLSNINEDLSAEDFINISERPEINYVDLGLTSGVLWADRNVGAIYTDKMGIPFAWAETETKEKFDWANYYDYDIESLGRFKKYIYSGKTTKYTIDDDPSTKYYGKFWKTPSDENYAELINECNWIWIKDGIFEGYELIGRNKNKIRIPISNKCSQIGLYWSCTLDKHKSSKYAKCLYIDSHSKKLKAAQRYLGLNVRPVFYYNIFGGIPTNPFAEYPSYPLMNLLLSYFN